MSKSPSSLSDKPNREVHAIYPSSRPRLLLPQQQFPPSVSCPLLSAPDAVHILAPPFPRTMSFSKSAASVDAGQMGAYL
jgi:hypothetical protein